MSPNIVFTTALIYPIAIGAVSVLLFFVTFYVFNRANIGVCKSKKRMEGKTVIITGCTSGIGKETAKGIAKRGARLIMACRNIDRANEIKEELIKESKNDNIVVRKLDLSSFASIREFAEQINREESKLDVLIHNAGTAELFKKKVSEDGIEMTLATNQYGPFLLTHLLIDLLKRSKPSRIVVVASSLYRLAGLNLNKLNPVEGFPAHLYYVSKYMNIVFTLELARRLKGTGVTANCLHPGIIDSGIWKSVPRPFSWIWRPFLKTFFKTVEEGAQTSIYLTVSDEVDGITGKYFSDCREGTLSNSIQDPSLGKKFWELSETIVKLQPTDPKI